MSIEIFSVLSGLIKYKLKNPFLLDLQQFSGPSGLLFKKHTSRPINVDQLHCNHKIPINKKIPSIINKNPTTPKRKLHLKKRREVNCPAQISPPTRKSPLLSISPCNVFTQASADGHYTIKTTEIIVTVACTNHSSSTEHISVDDEDWHIELKRGTQCNYLLWLLDKLSVGFFLRFHALGRFFCCSCELEQFVVLVNWNSLLFL